MGLLTEVMRETRFGAIPINLVLNMLRFRYLGTYNWSYQAAVIWKYRLRAQINVWVIDKYLELLVSG